MEIKISDEQIKQLAEQQIRNIISNKVGVVFKDRYYALQLKQIIHKCIEDTIREKVNKILPNEKLLDLITKEQVSEQAADKLVKAVSENIVGTLIQHGKDYY